MSWKVRAACAALGLWLCAPVAAGTPAMEARFEGSRSLLLEFDQPINNWDNALRADLVRTTPRLATTCQWDSDTRLDCHLDAAPAGATRYRIELAPGLVTQAGRPVGAQVAQVDTARPRVTASIARWQHGVPAIELAPNQPMDVTELRDALRVRLDGKSVAVVLRRLPPAWKGDTRIRFDLALPPVARADALLTLAIRPGLRSLEGPLRGEQDEELLKARLVAPFRLLGVACSGVDEAALAPVRAGVVVAACAPNQPVHLVFSHPVAEADRAAVARAAAVADPTGAASTGWSQRSSPFDAAGAQQAPAHWFQIEGPGPSTTIDLRLDGAVRDEDGKSLPPVAVRIRTGEAQPQLVSRDAALVADGAQPPALLQAVNVGETPLRLEGLGVRAVDTTLTARSPRQGSQPHPVRSSDAERVLAEGGWVRWTAQADTASYNWRRSIQFAAPGFDLVALSGRREVLAWANEWDRDAPVAGAKVELLWREPGVAEPRVIATGTTAADGTVLLKLPEALVLVPPTDDDAPRHAAQPQPAQWMLRAVRGGTDTVQRSVLPMDEVAASESGLGAALPRKVWGVSDRPMYRAGDTVHFRLWQRELDGVGLRAPRVVAPVTLRLQDDEDEKVVLEWQATPAADGSIAGEVVLPQHLTDATYCVGVPARYAVDGICFFVGTYRAQDLWAEARTQGGVLRDGERFTARVRAGYFSGGPAAGAELSRLEASLYPEALGTAYPAFADFTFIDVEHDDASSVELAGLGAYEALDGQGEARIDVPVKFDADAEELANRPAFGILALDAEASPEDREGTVARDEATRYAAYDRYVGLRTHPAWFGSTDPVSLEAVVITAQGKEVADARVEVSIEYLDRYDLTTAGTPLARCELRARVRTPCRFAREHSGFYRLTARSHGAAPATLQRYVWWRGGGAVALDDVEPDLTVLEAAQPDRPARLLLKQPFARARALLVVSHGNSILGHRVETIEGNVQELSQVRAKAWPGNLSVRALVRDAATPASTAGLRMPARIESLETWLYTTPPATAAAPLGVRFVEGAARPGATARLVLHNTTSRPRGVAVAVMDDALRAQAQRWLPYADPLGIAGFREGLLLRGPGWLQQHDFTEFDGDEWRWLLPWADAEAAAAALREQAAAVGFAAPPSPAPPAPAAPSSPRHARRVDAETAEATTLDRIEVTGSRIRRADIVESNEQRAPDPALRLARDGSVSGPARGAMVRAQFADTALWLPDVRLAPGERREIEVDLPDNLTRWRAVAWSADDGGDFAMAEAALEVGLPVEARLQAPVRLYPGDSSRVATSVRHVADAAAGARTVLVVRAESDAVHSPIDDAQTLALAPRGQGSVATILQPQAPGTLELEARASTAAGADAVAGRIEVASPLVTTRLRQAGWIAAEPLRLALPTVPAHAHDADLRVTLLRGGAGLTSEWTRELRDYPHRCWEQILSRAVGAALALEPHDPQWPDADAAAAVAEALDNAAVFQVRDGGFVYFTGMGERGSDGNVLLTAYTLRAFGLLRALGHPVPTRVEASAHEFLAEVDAPDAPGTGETLDEAEFAQFAYARAELATAEASELDVLWSQWKRLPLPLQVASAQAFARARHPATGNAAKRLVQAAPLRGSARSLRLPRRYDAWMSSAMREQCALLALLDAQPQLAAPRVRRELRAGIGDLYAGGAPSVDTQTAAYCLMALREPLAAAAVPLQARFANAAHAQTLALAPGQARAEWAAGAPQGPVLEVSAAGDAAAPASYVAELAFQEDARLAQPAAAGLALERRHEVLRNGAWKPVQGESLREGDWLRITLVVRNSAERDFVALTDDVPGGLQPTDLTLSGVGTAELERIADTGSGYFAARKLDPRKPKFYADTLPAGLHEVHYFARVGNAGDYLAAPAVAELMYGEATRARTAASRLRFDVGGK